MPVESISLDAPVYYNTTTKNVRPRRARWSRSGRVASESSSACLAIAHAIPLHHPLQAKAERLEKPRPDGMEGGVGPSLISSWDFIRRRVEQITKGQRNLKVLLIFLENR